MCNTKFILIQAVNEMKRNAMQDLLRWKADEERKPLVLKGARQVGKTWLMKEFGRVAYAGYVYFNFDEEDALKSIFAHNKNPQRIIELLSLVAGEKIEPETTLIIFDEVQECPEALNALKYFKEKASEYHVIAAGSLLGTLLAQPKSYPVGMVNLLEIQPLTFDEFLEATDESLFRYYECIEKGQVIEEIFHKRLLDAYHNYLIIGALVLSIVASLYFSFLYFGKQNYWQLFLLLAPAWIVVYLASRLRKRPDKEKNA